MGMAENVVLLRNKDGKTVYQRIMNFLGDKSHGSEKTRAAYETDIRDFFKAVLVKPIEEMTESDLTDFDNDDVIAYKNALVDIGYKPASVNRKLSSVRSLYHTLSASLNVKEEVFNVDRVKGKSKGWGALSWEETREMIERVMEHENGTEKSLIIEMAARTGFRIGSVLALTWDDLFFSEADNLWVVQTHVDENKIVSKGQKADEASLTIDFYNRLQVLRNETDNKLFHLADKTMRRAMEKLCEEMNIDPRRNIKFHSIKKMGVNFILDATGDVRAAQEYANHSNAATTLNSYAEHNRSYSNKANLLIGEEIDLSVLSSLSAEQILEAIKSCDMSTQRKVVVAAQKLTGN